MKILFTILSILFALMNHAQDDKAIVEKLFSQQLITKYEKDETIKEIKGREEHLKKFKDQVYDYENKHEWAHYPLIMITTAKMYSTSGIKSMFFRPAPVRIEKNKEKIFIDRLTKFNQQLLNAKYISNVTFAELQNLINQLSLRSEYEVAHKAALITEKEYFLKPEHYEKFARQLKQKRLIKEEDYATILSKCRNGVFRNYDEPLKHLQNMIVIDIKNYSAKSKEGLEKIYRKTSEVLPELSFDSFNYKIEKNNLESSKDFIVYDLTASLKKDNTVYAYKSFYDAEYSNKNKDELPQPSENYYQVFNKILADKESPYRLHQLSLNDTSFGIIALTKEQFKDLMWSYDGMMNDGYIRLSYENFYTKLTRRKVLEAIKLYDSIGLFNHLTETQKNDGKAKALAEDVKYFSDVLACFKDLVFEIDLEYGVDSKQYEKITKELSKVSHGKFQPSLIVDNYSWKNKQAFDFGFALNGKKYLTKLVQEDDWLDLKFWELIEKAINEQSKNEQFYDIYPNDGMRVIYLSQNQYKVLKEKNMLELDRESINETE